MSQMEMQNKQYTNIVAKEKQIIIKGNNIHKTYLFGLEGVAALRGINIDIQIGQFIIILGNSGGGKTSLLNIIGTIDKLTKGNLTLVNEKIKSNTKDQILSGLRLNYLGFVFQTYNLISSLTAKQNVELPMILKGDLNTSEIQNRAQSLLAQVQMSHRLKHYPNQLSGGEQQRVTIARALANNPKLLLLDEPTGDLDSKNSHIVMDILISLNIQEKITIIMVTHDVNMKFYSHRVLKVLDGKIIGEEQIDAAIRQESIQQLRKQIYEENQEENQLFSDKKIYTNKQIQQYGVIKWLKEKQIKQQIQQEIKERIEKQRKKINHQMNQEQ